LVFPTRRYAISFVQWLHHHETLAILVNIALVATDGMTARINEKYLALETWYPACLLPIAGKQMAMVILMKQMRETLDLNDLLLIISIGLFVPFRLSFPLAAKIVSRRINIHLTFGDHGGEHSSTRAMPIPSGASS
jgi:hypothetical protein